MKLVFRAFVPVLAVLLLAQTPTTATVRTPQGDRTVNLLHENGQTYFPADDVLAAVGGVVSRDGNGFKATLGQTSAAFGSESRFGVVREDLIEMPVAPLAVDGKPYVPWQFFQGFLTRANDMEALWDPTARILTLRPVQHNVVSVQLSVANIQGISKVVVTLTAPAEYAIIKEPGAYTVRFKAQIRPPFADQQFEDPYVARATFSGSDLRLQLTAPDVAADTYRLDNPFRVVLDLRKGAAPTGAAPPISTKPVEPPGIRTIVIDPGHGGTQVGAIGPGGLMEKDATLALCQKLAAALEAKLKTRVVLTRNDDSLVSLDQRTALANQYHADLFLSVHMNAAVVKGAKGSETYFLSLEASDELAKKAAETENATATAGQPPAQSDLKLILWDLAQQEYLQESSRLATDVQEEMNRISGVTNRGVKQAPFKVLVGATMPAALVEVAFITNPTEEAKIKSDEFQKTVVDALTTAIGRYKTDYETRIGLVQPAPPPTTTAAPGTTTTGTAPAPPASTPTTTTTTSTTTTTTKGTGT